MYKNTTEKGDDLENKFYNYLINQKDSNTLVLDSYPYNLCKIHQKKEYYSNDRENNIEFDIVIEFFRENSNKAHTKIVFECKNYNTNIPEEKIRIFSDQISDISKHGCRGIFVTTKGLQSGALNVARNRGISVIKFDHDGLEWTLERNQRKINHDQLKKYLIKSDIYQKSLKFSAMHNEQYFDNCSDFFNSFLCENPQYISNNTPITIPFIPRDEIEEKSQSLLNKMQYDRDNVNLEYIANTLKIKIINHEYEKKDLDNNDILGQADFKNKKIVLFDNKTLERKRFTLAHEIGHFVLEHDKYISSESVIKQDLLIQQNTHSPLDGLEYQANYFASCLLLPKDKFLDQTDDIYKGLGFRERGHGFIYVDNQPQNRARYNLLIDHLSKYFCVSKQAVEIRLKNLNLLNDQRSFNQDIKPTSAAGMFNGHLTISE